MAALSMMEKSELGDPARGNPLLVVKALSRVVSTNTYSMSNKYGTLHWSGADPEIINYQGERERENCVVLLMKFLAI